ncbi:MAG: AmmeMemoRadiSam system protein A [Gammaproteobacteria bacterium]|nr:AmmeMemoRadiSam system protein A [Gammaproteobacteria bacterium]
MSTNYGEVLLPIARTSIAEALGQTHHTAKDAEWLQQQGACFVTLTQQDQLRGCIGTLEAHRSLLDDVKNNATAAAFKDPRFSPLTGEELGLIEIEISLLSAMQALDFSDEQEALAQLQPGVDGVVFEFGHYRSTFLPQVWQQLPSTEDFMAHLKRKAGMDTNFWADQVKLSRYTVSKWKERDFAVQKT